MDRSQTPPSERATVRGRTARNAVYDRAAIEAILDEGMVCHVGFVEDGEPFVIPMSYARVGDAVYVHGSRAGRTMRVLTGGGPVCVEVTIVDGLVLGPAPTLHGVNYRSVVLFGRGREVTDPAERLAALKAILEHAIPGRWADLRAPTVEEAAEPAVAAIPIGEASAKVRSGPLADDGRETPAGLWTGVLPLRLSALDPVPAPGPGPDVPMPEYVQRYRRGSSRMKAGGTRNGARNEAGV